jgi:hypothetical protein
MKVISKLVISLILFFGTAQAAKAEAGVYELDVVLTSVGGTASREFKTGDTIKVMSVLADMPEDYKLISKSPGDWERTLPRVATIGFDSNSFARMWPGWINGDLFSRMTLNKRSTFIDFDNTVYFSSQTEGVSSGKRFHEHLVSITLRDNIKSYREGKIGNNSFFAVISTSENLDYTIRGDIMVVRACNSQCQSQFRGGIPPFSNLYHYNETKMMLMKLTEEEEKMQEHIIKRKRQRERENARQRQRENDRNNP